MFWDQVIVPKPMPDDMPLMPDVAEWSDSQKDAYVQPLLDLPPFRDMKIRRLPAILLHHTRRRSHDAGEIILRRGDYGSSAFFVLSGTVRVEVESAEGRLPPELLGNSAPRRRGWLGALAQLWRAPRLPEVRRHPHPALEAKSPNATATQPGSPDGERAPRFFLQDVPAILDEFKTARLEPGTLFGEIGAYNRTPRTATVFSEEGADVLEIRWQGLRELRRNEEFRRHFDEIYRQRALRSHLREAPLFRNLDEAALEQVVASAVFAEYGDTEWTSTFDVAARTGSTERLESEPVIAREGLPPPGLILVQSGFARLSQRYGRGHRTLSYLGRGSFFGLEELVSGWRMSALLPLRYTLRAIGYVHTIRVPVEVLLKIVFPAIPPDRLPKVEEVEIPESLPMPGSDSLLTMALGAPRQHKRLGQRIGTGMLEFLVDHRFLNGKSAMLVDLDRCTRCNDCVQACAATHDNNPRFVLHGPQYGKTMVANACMHCYDPVCMIGCPTGAISRSSFEGQVLINDRTCIGCSVCAKNCPYDNIRMVPIRNLEGALVVSQSDPTRPILKATACDLCASQMTGLGPACERACPHDALRRLDMQDLDRLADWLNR